MARRKRRLPMPERPPETRGERIKRYRLAAGLSQPELAARLRVSLATVSRWETAERIPQQSHREPLAAALGTTWQMLLHGETSIQAIAQPGAALPLTGRAVGDRRRPGLQPLRDAISQVQGMGEDVLTEFVNAVLELAHSSRFRRSRQ